MQLCYLELILSVIQIVGAPCYSKQLYIPQVVQARNMTVSTVASHLKHKDLYGRENQKEYPLLKIKLNDRGNIVDIELYILWNSITGVHRACKQVAEKV